MLSATELPPDKNNPQYSPPKTSFSLPSNPKLIILIAMSVLILILLFLNLIFSSPHQYPATNTPTPSPRQSLDEGGPTPTLPPANIPTQFIDSFNQIDQLLLPESDFLPPSLDPKINP